MMPPNMYAEVLLGCYYGRSLGDGSVQLARCRSSSPARDAVCSLGTAPLSAGTTV